MRKTLTAVISVLLVSIALVAVAFRAGVVYASGGFPSLNRALNDYSVLITDLNQAIVEVNRKKDVDKSHSKELNDTYEEMVAQLQKIKEQQKEAEAWKKFLDQMFGSSDSNDSPPAPVRRRPPSQ
jgi:hypothetical protein